MSEHTTPRFALGRTLATPGALALLAQQRLDAIEFLQRHVLGQWGDLCEEDALCNERALQCGDRLMSVYALPDGGTIWIITEGDCTCTTVLLPQEY